MLFIKLVLNVIIYTNLGLLLNLIFYVELGDMRFIAIAVSGVCGFFFLFMIGRHLWVIPLLLSIGAITTIPDMIMNIFKSKISFKSLISLFWLIVLIPIGFLFMLAAYRWYINDSLISRDILFALRSIHVYFSTFIDVIKTFFKKFLNT